MRLYHQHECKIFAVLDINKRDIGERTLLRDLVQINQGVIGPKNHQAILALHSHHDRRTFTASVVNKDAEALGEDPTHLEEMLGRVCQSPPPSLAFSAMVALTS